jgi:preprotein translocase subunit SecA
MLQRLGLQEGEAIIHPWINKALEKAQQKVEARNFDIRKNLLKFDNVMNDQRKVIYEQRKDLMRTPDVSEEVTGMRHEVIGELVAKAMPPNSYAEQWNTKGLHEECLRVVGLDLPVADWAKEEGIDDDAVRERIIEASNRKMAEKAANLGPDFFRMVEKKLLLDILDHLWKSHLLELDHLRHGIGLRAYGQRDPLREYQAEAFSMFELMLDRLRENVTSVLSRVQIQRQVPEETLLQRQPQAMRETREDPAMVGTGPQGDEAPTPMARPTTVRRPAVNAADPSTWGSVSRNAPCPCGSGKKYKYCHGKMLIPRGRSAFDDQPTPFLPMSRNLARRSARKSMLEPLTRPTSARSRPSPSASMAACFSRWAPPSGSGTI